MPTSFCLPGSGIVSMSSFVGAREVDGGTNRLSGEISLFVDMEKIERDMFLLVKARGQRALLTGIYCCRTCSEEEVEVS